MTLFEVILLITSILQVILFFKIWDMTTNVSKMKQKLDELSIFFMDPACLYAIKFSKQILKENLPKEITSVENTLIIKTAEKIKDNTYQFSMRVIQPDTTPYTTYKYIISHDGNYTLFSGWKVNKIIQVYRKGLTP